MQVFLHHARISVVFRLSIPVELRRNHKWDAAELQHTVMDSASTMYQRKCRELILLGETNLEENNIDIKSLAE